MSGWTVTLVDVQNSLMVPQKTITDDMHIEQ